MCVRFFVYACVLITDELPNNVHNHSDNAQPLNNTQNKHRALASPNFPPSLPSVWSTVFVFSSWRNVLNYVSACVRTLVRTQMCKCVRTAVNASSAAARLSMTSAAVGECVRTQAKRQLSRSLSLFRSVNLRRQCKVCSIGVQLSAYVVFY